MSFASYTSDESGWPWSERARRLPRRPPRLSPAARSGLARRPALPRAEHRGEAARRRAQEPARLAVRSYGADRRRSVTARNTVLTAPPQAGTILAPGTKVLLIVAR